MFIAPRGHTKISPEKSIMNGERPLLEIPSDEIDCKAGHAIYEPSYLVKDAVQQIHGNFSIRYIGFRLVILIKNSYISKTAYL
jgi:hypothetical protein